MKKYFIIILLILTLLFSLNAFNYERYKIITVEELLKIIEDSAEDGPPGICFFPDTPVGFSIQLENYPDLSNDINYKNEIKYFKDRFRVEENVFGYVQEIKIKDKKLILVNQIKLAEYLIKDVKVNEKIGIYCIIGYYNTFDKKIVCLVNAFNTVSDYKRRNVKPIWEK